MIENEDGDIIRRYKVNKHAPAPRARSGSIMGMVKSMVGIKPPPEISVTDLEHGTQHKIILPEENTPMSSKTEQKLEDTIANILKKTHPTHLRRECRRGGDGSRKEDCKLWVTCQVVVAIEDEEE